MKEHSAKLTSKGQITLPARLRERLGVKPGDRIDFVEGESGNIEIVARRKTIHDLRGIVPYHGPPLSNEDLVRLVEGARDARAEEIVRSMSKRRS